MLHGWLLDGSGSNIYVKDMSYSLANQGHKVHIFCQDPHPEKFSNEPFTVDIPPISPSLMPVFVGDTAYEGFEKVQPFHEIAGSERLELYLKEFTAGAMELCKKYQIDLIHANHIYPMPEIARRIKESLNIPFVIFIHGSAIEYAIKKSNKLAKVASTAVNAADALIVGNQAVSERVFRLFPHETEEWKKKHHIVPVGVNTSLFEPIDPANRNKSIEKFVSLEFIAGGKTKEITNELTQKTFNDDASLIKAVEENHKSYNTRIPDQDLPEKLKGIDWNKTKTLVYIGKLITGKGIHDLMMALPTILDSHPNTQLLIVGDGPYRETLELMLKAISTGDKGLLERIIRLGYGLDNQVTSPLPNPTAYLKNFGIDKFLKLGRKTNPIEHVIFGGYLKHKYFQYLLPYCDFGIFPSEVAEAYGMVLFESLSAGVLPMGTHYDGMGEGLEHIGKGLGPELAPLICIPTDHDLKIPTIAENTVKLLHMPVTWRTKCRKIALNYSWESLAKRISKVYSGCLEASLAKKGLKLS